MQRLSAVRFTSNWSLLILLLTASLFVIGCDSNDSGMEDPDPDPEVTTLADIVSSTDNLSTLAAALDATGQASTLADANAEFTVFAPANSAFDNVDVQSLVDNPELTTGLLNFHIVAGETLTYCGGRNADRQRSGRAEHRHHR